MHIEVFRSDSGDDMWFWHFRNRGRITAGSEAFPTKQHALRAAKGVVRAVCKYVLLGDSITFTVSRDEKTGMCEVRWG